MDISNYRPISILPVISKVYERLIFYQVNKHFDPIFSKYQCGFRKGYSTQYCMILLVEKWKRLIDTRGCAGALPTAMSKAFVTLSLHLSIAKLSAYGVDILSLLLIHIYLNH